MVTFDIYRDIKAALAELITSETIRTFGIWNSQFQNEDVERAFNFPTVFVEFQNIDWESRLSSQEKRTIYRRNGIYRIILHVGFSDLYNETQRFENQIEDTLEAIYKALDISGDCYTNLVLVNETTDTNYNRVLDWQMVYETTGIDEQVDTDVQDATSGGGITIQIETDLDLKVEDDEVTRTAKE